MLEEWNVGGMERDDDGTLEGWNNGTMENRKKEKVTS
jgi:hypothetical protein